MINIKLAKSYRTVSNDALCIITGLMAKRNKIQEAANLYEMFKTEGTNNDRAINSRHWIHPSKHIKIVEEQERITHSLQVYTDGSKSETGVAVGIAVFEDNNLIATWRFRHNGRSTKIRQSS